MDFEINPHSVSGQAGLEEAEAILAELASVFFHPSQSGARAEGTPKEPGPSLEARYRVLLDQIPAVVFMAYLDEDIGEAM